MALVPGRFSALTNGSSRVLSESLAPLYVISYRMKSGVEKKDKEVAGDVATTSAAAIALTAPKPKKRFYRLHWGIRDRGLHRFDGDHVQQGTTLARQFKLDYHPGQHVGISGDKTVFAREPGRVMITSEIIDPRWENQHVKDFYEGRKGQVIFKKFIHVIPDPLPKKFRLVSLV